MSKWSVALFGFYKPNWYIIEKNYDTTVFESVDEPAWSDYDKQWEADVHYWDEDSKQWIDDHYVFPESVYRLYQVKGNETRCVPGDIIAFKPWENPAPWTNFEKKVRLIVTVIGPTRDQMCALKEKLWAASPYKIPAEYPAEKQYIEPTKYDKKRRMQLTLPTLKAMGVDEEKMLEPRFLYVPTIADIEKYSVFDKLKNRNVDDTDGLNVMPDLEYGGSL